MNTAIEKEMASIVRSMNKIVTIVVTGAAGFIGSCLAGFLNEKGYDNLILVDEFSRLDKVDNLEDKKFRKG